MTVNAFLQAAGIGLGMCEGALGPMGGCGSPQMLIGCGAAALAAWCQGVTCLTLSASAPRALVSMCKGSAVPGMWAACAEGN